MIKINYTKDIISMIKIDQTKDRFWPSQLCGDGGNVVAKKYMYKQI